MALPKITDPVDNISSQPDQPLISATSLKALFDEIGKDIKEFINNVFTVFLEGSSAASNLGQNNGSYGPTIQDAIDTITSAGVGTIPPDGTITNLKLATDVKVGSLASSTTTDKSSVIAVTNEIKASLTSKADVASFRKFVSLSELAKSDATLTDVPDISISVVAGKTYKLEAMGKYQTGATTTGIKLGVYLPSGAGTIIGKITAYPEYIINLITLSGVSQVGIVAIGASGLASSFIQTTGITNINLDLLVTSDLVFTCSSSGVLKFQFASEVAAASKLITGFTVLVTEYQ